MHHRESREMSVGEKSSLSGTASQSEVKEVRRD